MNAPATANLPARAPLQSGGQVAAIIPQTIEDAFRVANAFSASGLAPQSLKGPEAILVSIMAGAELGFAPYQAMQSFAVINGRASIWGDAIPALLWSRGFDIEETFDDEDNPTKATCVVTRPSGKEIRRTFSLKDAKEAGLLDKQGPWKTARKRMLQMRARAFAARDGAADVLRGMPVYEEVADFQEIRDVTPPKPVGLAARLAASAPAAEGFTATRAEAVEHDEQTGEIIDAEVTEIDEPFPGDQPAPVTAEAPAATVAEQPTLTIAERAAAFRKRMGEATNPLKLKSIRKAADNLFDDMERSDPEGRVELAFEYEERLLALEEAEREGAGA